MSNPLSTRNSDALHNSFAYDLADRLKTATVSGTTETYTYAGDGTRLSASTGAKAAKTTRLLWDQAFGLPRLALERNGNDALLRSYRYGLDLLSQAAGSKVPATSDARAERILRVLPRKSAITFTNATATAFFPQCPDARLRA